jgi:hypothetical protein
MLPSPSATDPYRFLSRFGDVSPIANRVMPDWFPRLDFDLGKLCYFYGQREDISTNATRTTELLMNSLVPLPAGSKALSFDERHSILPDFRPCQILAGQAWFRPMTAKDRAEFADNLSEYRKRYATMKWDTYLSQMQFFADTLNTAQEKGIKVVVVTMPITQLNRSLLSDLSFTAYRNGVIALAKRKGATVLDFSASEGFKQSDFMDTVHLHAGGGKLLFDQIIDKLSADHNVVSALSGGSANKSIAAKGGDL